VEQQKRVLVVDDDHEIRNLLSGAFTQYGLSVDTAADGAAAIDLISQTPYCVIVLDLVMPGVDGFSVLNHVRTRTEETQPVVIVITGAEEPIVAALDARLVHGIMRKPFDVQEVTNIVAACAEIRTRSTFDKMALAALFAAPPLMAWLSRLQ
jgi:DNA-binding response OmpR family regulator